MMIHQKSYIEKTVERFDVSTTSNTSASTTTDPRPREELEEELEGP